MSDHTIGADHLWSEVIGQDAAITQLKAALVSPVHAYLLVGPEGSGKRAAARAFAAELLADGLDDHGTTRSRHLAATEAHPALHVVEREGATISVGQADEVVRQSSMAPPEGNRQVILMVDFHLIGVAAPKLLKSIEEPPPTTVFVILAEELPPELVTIASRCVRIDFAAVPASALAQRLVDEGIDAEAAELAASGAGGSLTRARLLARDSGAAARRDAWYRAPERLDGSGAAACAAADELLGLIDGLLEPLSAQQAEETETFMARSEAAGTKLKKGDLDQLEKRHKREQRRVRADELRAGLGVLVGRYRDELAGGAPADDFVNAAEQVQRMTDNLVFNVNETLALQALFVSLPRMR